MATLYSTARWHEVRARAIARDHGVCTVSRLLGGACTSGRPLHVHHIHALADGGDPYDLTNVATTCAAHHPMWEALRRQLVKQRLTEAPRCTHWHASAEARRLCEARLARRTVAA